jgi:hypothetical protein
VTAVFLVLGSGQYADVAAQDLFTASTRSGAFRLGDESGALEAPTPRAMRTLFASPELTQEAVNAPSQPSAVNADTPTQPKPATPAELKRPKIMVPLYASYAALQLLDAKTTLTGIQQGAVETNPLVNKMASNPGLLVGMKLATVAATVYAGELLWKRNRLAAVVTMIALNSGYAAIVAHNYRVIH